MHDIRANYDDGTHSGTPSLSPSPQASPTSQLSPPMSHQQGNTEDAKQADSPSGSQGSRGTYSYSSAYAVFFAATFHSGTTACDDLSSLCCEPSANTILPLSTVCLGDWLMIRCVCVCCLLVLCCFISLLLVVCFSPAWSAHQRRCARSAIKDCAQSCQFFPRPCRNGDRQQHLATDCNSPNCGQRENPQPHSEFGRGGAPCVPRGNLVQAQRGIKNLPQSPGIPPAPPTAAN